MKSSASEVRYGCGMRVVFSAMRRSFASTATALASPSRGARRTSRAVSRTGILLSRNDSEGISSNVMARAPLKSLRGRRYPSPPLRARLGPPVRTDTGGPYGSTVLLGRRLRCRKYRNEHAAFGFGIELDATVGESEQRVIRADPDIAAGVPLGAALARENIAGQDDFAAVQLDPKALGGRVTAVARRSACFLMSHGLFLNSLSFYPDSVTESS